MTQPLGHDRRIVSDDVRDTLAKEIQRAVEEATGSHHRLFELLPMGEQHDIKRAAVLAVRSLSKTAHDVAEWRAAEQLAYALYGREWDALGPSEQQRCRVFASAAIFAYRCHLWGLDDAYTERRAIDAAEHRCYRPVGKIAGFISESEPYGVARSDGGAA